MKILNKQDGFSLHILIIAVLVIGVISLVGYRVLHKNGTDKNSQTSQTTTGSDQPTSITNQEDLSNAVDSLKEIDTNTQEDEKALQNL